MKTLKTFILFLILCSGAWASEMNIIFIGDPHTFGDADDKEWQLKDERLRTLRLSGEYVNMFVDKLLKNPDYVPEGEEWKLVNGFCLASAIAYIIKHEDPDMVIIGGDYHPIGMLNLWPGFGLKDYDQATTEDIMEYQKIFDLYVHNIFSRIPCAVKFVHGNHDVPPPLKEGCIKRINPIGRRTECIEIKKNGFGVMLMILDSESGNRNPIEMVEDYKIGEWQKGEIERVLERNRSTTYKILVQHKMFGGWPGDVYGDFMAKPVAIGQAALPNDYKKLQEITGINFSIPDIDQCWLTDIMLKHEVDLSLYAHNHIFHSRNIKDLKLVCMGTTKFAREKSWWETLLWTYFYGSWRTGDFWGCGGITKVTINEKEMKVEYIKTSSINRTNLPEGSRVGDVLERIYIKRR